MCKAKETQRTD